MRLLMPALLIPVAVTVLFNATVELNNGHQHVTQDIDKLPECPHSWSNVVWKPSPQAVPIFGSGPSYPQSIAHVRTDVPEYHDCQRLLKGSANQYGPLVAVFASDSLDDLTHKLGLTKDVELVDPPAGNPADQGVAAVQILNTSARSLGYSGLNLQKNTYAYCIYLYSGGSGWEAWMVPAPNIECDLRTTREKALETGAAMTVTPYRIGTYTEADYPPVARWDWDGTSQYIGTKCGRAWCQLAFVTTDYTAYTPPAGATSPVDRRVFEIKGWFDEQRLAPATGGNTVSNARGVVIPNGKLDAMDNTSVFKDTWTFAGMVYISTNIYHAKFSLTAAMPTSGTPSPPGNRVYFRARRVAANTVVTYPQACNDPDMTSQSIPDAQPGKIIWENKIENSKGGCMIYQLIRRPQPWGPMTANGAVVPVIGTLRWRWEADDEKYWGECGTGCCQIER